MIIPEKLTSVERALVAASKMDAPDARRVLMLICEAGMTTGKPVPPEPTEGEKHFAKREKFIQRMDATCKRVIKYAKHETLRKIEKHFRDNPTPISAAESGSAPTESRASLAARLTFNRSAFGSELLAALREDQEAALGTAGQQLFDEIGKDSVWRLPSQDAIQFVQDRANLLANVPDEIHREIMDSIEQGLQHGESRRELMARISAAFDEIGKARSETIANTETAAAFNYSRDKAMREAGVTHKRWLHSMSPLIKEPRPTHLEADGHTVPIDEPFDVGGVLFMRPADDSLGAGPEDIINCHCVSIAVEAPLESGEGEGHPFRGNQWTRPDVLFHGTRDKEGLEGRLKNVSYENPIHIGTEQQASAFHATGKVFKIHADISNPAMAIRDANWSHDAQDSLNALSHPNSPFAATKPLYWKIQKQIDGAPFDQKTSTLMREVEKAGFDSIRYPNEVEGSGHSYIIWDPKRIKKL